jgi:hypothetical protein
MSQLQPQIKLSENQAAKKLRKIKIWSKKFIYFLSCVKYLK